MNRPGDRVHHVHWSFCRLILPLFRGRWLAFVEGMHDVDGSPIVEPHLRVVERARFHNCRTSGS